MTEERWRRIKALFQAAVERPAGERDAFLAAEAGNDLSLRQDVESLLQSDNADNGMLDRLPVADNSVLAGALMPSPSTIEPPPDRPVFTAGVRFGSYEIVAPLGAGAMGEVYRATDTRLNRDVALKVLPAPFCLDADRRARFEREAQLLAALNHSNIAAIYGLDESHGTQALVLELIDGPTLDARLAGGPIPLNEALVVARQVADAMEAAHDKGIIHRDLKPANIKITESGVVKVLDFGLARVWDGAPPSGLSVSPALTAIEFGPRAILGTPAYMSPEQARGQPLDKRADIWSFGCLLYEMLTGRTPFGGDTISDTLAAILEREPDHDLLPAATPASIRTLLRRCLEKDRRRRLDSAAAARLEIDDALSAPAHEPARRFRPSRRATRVVAAAVIGVALLAGAAMWPRLRPDAQLAALPSRFAVTAPAGQPLNVSGLARDLAVSPDGQRLVYRVGGSNTAGSPLVVRMINELDARPLAGITAAYAPFFSPDSQWIGFFENAELKKASVGGGPAITLCPVNGRPLGASWGDDNTIVFATDDRPSGLLQVSADGGEPRVLTTVAAELGEGDHQFPFMLPGSASVLFTIAQAKAGDFQVAVLDLRSGRQNALMRGSQAEYVSVPGATAPAAGYLVYASAGTLSAVRFDPVRLAIVGEAQTVLERPLVKINGATNYGLSGTGTLAFIAGSPEHTAPRSLVWVDRSGREEAIEAPQRAYGGPRLSPDGTRLAVDVYDGNGDLWIWDFASETLRQFTSDPAGEGMAVWTPDGRQIVFMSSRSGIPNVFEQAADGTGPTELVSASAHPQWPTSIMFDGSWLAGFDLLPRADSNIVFFPMQPRAPKPARHAGPSPAALLATTPFKGAFAEFSPNGRYLAYQTADSGRNEVYVRPFPNVDRGVWQVSTSGATRPAWAKNGRELFYLDGSNALTKVDVVTIGDTFKVGRPSRVFDTIYLEPNPSRHYDISADGQRFLMLKSGSRGDQDEAPASMVVVLHWFEALKVRLAD